MLRRMHLSDVDRFATYRKDAELARYQGWEPMSTAAAAAFIEEMRCAPALVRDKWLQIAIAEQSDGQIIGDIGFCLRSDGDLEVGFTLRSESHNKGFATEAMTGFAKALLGQPTVQRIVGVVDSRNSASIRVLEKLNMKRVSSETTEFKGNPCIEHRFELKLPS